MTVAEARTHIATLTDVAALQQLLEGETRKGVIDAVHDRLAELQQEGQDEDGAEATSAAPQAAPAAEDTPGADTATAPEDAPAAAEDTTHQAPAAPVKTGKGSAPKEKPTALYVLLNPNAKGKIGYKGYLHDRATVAADQHMLAELYKAGCRQVKKLV